jgi:molybdenum cofactor cytidylyltransferase
MREVSSKTIGAILLAAGRSSRMPPSQHKLLSEFDGVPLVRRSATTLLEAGLSATVVVIGHRPDEIQSALTGLPLTIAFNPRRTDGMGTSIASAFSQPRLAKMYGVIVMLADMPDLRSHHIRRLVEVFLKEDGKAIVRGSFGAKPGHPVMFPRNLFDQLRMLDGETGEQNIVRTAALPVRLCDIGPAALCDVDALTALINAGGKPSVSTIR